MGQGIAHPPLPFLGTRLQGLLWSFPRGWDGQVGREGVEGEDGEEIPSPQHPEQF